MTSKPTGRLEGDDLVMTRTFRAPIEDVWTSVTSSESTARWYGPWERVPGEDDNQIRVQMIQEEGKPWMEATIERCDPPHTLTLLSKGDYGLRLSLRLTESAGSTTLELVHHRVDRKAMGDFGPGWEFYLDSLVAAREGKPLPKFETYYPAQKEYFASL